MCVSQSRRRLEQDRDRLSLRLKKKGTLPTAGCFYPTRDDRAFPAVRSGERRARYPRSGHSARGAMSLIASSPVSPPSLTG
jgi:hypothetical protein